MRYVTFALLLRYFLNMSRAWLFLIQEVVIIANVKPFHTKSVMNKPQAQGRRQRMLNAGAEGVLDQWQGSREINSKYDQNRLLLLLFLYE